MANTSTKANICFAFVFSPIGNVLVHQVHPNNSDSHDLWRLAVASHPTNPISEVTEQDAHNLIKTEWGIQGGLNTHGTFTYEHDGVESTGHLFSMIYDGELTHNTNTILNWQYASPDDMLSFIAQGRIHPISLQAYQALMASI